MSLFSRLFGSSVPRKTQMPAGVWLAAIGDIHGQLDPLNRLLSRIEAISAESSARRKILVFVGDFIDRGLKSRQVIDRMIAGFPGFETWCLRGNHDETLLQFLDDAAVAESWRNYGGLETLASYGVGRTKTGDWKDTQAELRAKLPPEHLRFFQGLQMRFQIGDYIFVHAGLRPGIPLEAQSDQDLMWIRDDFLNSRADFGGLVVHGHTPKPEPDVRPNRIGIDTGAYMTGVLTALILSGDTRLFINSRDG